MHCSFIPVTWSVVHHRAGSWEGFFFPLFWIRTLVVQGKAGTLPLSALTKPCHTHLHYVNRLFAVCSSFHLRSWINIAICAPFCLLKNTFLILYWVLVVSTWYNEHGWIILKLKSHSCFICKHGIYLKTISFTIYYVQTRVKYQVWESSGFFCLECWLTTVLAPPFFSCLNANSVTNK